MGTKVPESKAEPWYREGGKKKKKGAVLILYFMKGCFSFKCCSTILTTLGLAFDMHRISLGGWVSVMRFLFNVEERKE